MDDDLERIRRAGLSPLELSREEIAMKWEQMNSRQTRLRLVTIPLFSIFIMLILAIVFPEITTIGIILFHAMLASFAIEMIVYLLIRAIFRHQHGEIVCLLEIAMLEHEIERREYYFFYKQMPV